MLQPKELVILPKSASIESFDLGCSDMRRIIACPNAPIAAVKAGQAISVPSGTFDVELIQAQLPDTFQPDFVSLSARVMTFIPRGLEKFNCPKVMKIGDTFHYGDGSLSGIIRYCQMLDCDYHWTYQSVHHLHFFIESGLKNVFWLPATIVIDPYVPLNATQISNTIVFRGSESELHCYRRFILQRLQSAFIPIDIQSKPYRTCLEDYAKAHIVINCSLNGDSNRRVFEVLMAGGFLISDRISFQTGLYTLFQEGVHFEGYGNESELIEKIQYYLTHPEKAKQIAATGQQKLLECYSQQAAQQNLYRYVIHNEIAAPFRVEHDTRIQAIQTDSTLKLRIKLYELIQELHRVYRSLNLLYHNGENAALASDLADLPRLNVIDSNLAESTIAQIVLIDASNSLHTLQQKIRAVDRSLDQAGFLIVVGQPKWWITVRLTQWLKKQGMVPIRMQIDLFNQTHDLSTIGHPLIYQKITPQEHRNSQSLMAPLKTIPIPIATVLLHQFRLLPFAVRLKKIIRR